MVGVEDLSRGTVEIVPVVIAENRIKNNFQRSIHVLPPGLPAGVLQALNTDGVEVVSNSDADVERRLLMIRHDCRSNLLLFACSGPEVAKSHYFDPVLLLR